MYNYYQKNKGLICVIVGITCAILLIIGMILCFVVSAENIEDECELLGGTYKVVDKEYTPRGYMNVYGCVK